MNTQGGHVMRYSVAFTRLFTLFFSSVFVNTAIAQTAIEEVVVTAQKRAETLADVPLSITAITPEVLDGDNIKNVAELSSQAPGLTVAKNEGFSRAVAIRGIGFETTQNVISVPSVAFHIDGVFIPDANALNLDFIDIERVEVLRGPQGTLFGQNSTGGTINVINKVPELREFGGKFDIGVGNYSLVQPRGTINIPLGEAVAVRASATYLNHDGFSEISSGPLDGYDLDEADNLQFQGKLLWQPNDNFSAIFSGTHFQIDSIHDRAQRHVSDPSGNIRDLTQDTAGTFDLDTQLFSLTLEWNTPVATIKSITGYVENDMANFLDNDRGANAFLGVGTQDITISTRDSEAWTQEINIVSNNEDSRLDWILGGFYMDFDKDVFFDEFIDFNGNGIAEFGNPAERSFVVLTLANRESWSIYGQGTFDISDRLRLTGGVRYTDDTISSSVCVFFCAVPSMPSQSETEVTGKGAVEWDATENLMVYFSYTRGFKPGGNNLNTVPAIVPQLTQSETVDAFEIGAKGEFLENRLQLFASGFYYEYDNMQFLTQDPAPFQGGVDNVPEAEVLGFELEMKALLSDGLTLDAGFSVLDTEFTADFLALDPVVSAGLNGAIFGAGGNPFNPFDPIATGIRASALQNIKGNSLPKAPDFSTNISLTYEASLPFGALTSRLSFTHRDSFASRVFGETGINRTPGYELVNLNFHLKPSSFPNWGLVFLVTNLTDEDAVNSRWTNNFGIQSTSEEFVAPRQFIGRISYEF
ncbi:MAG: TonB-dependent receptor [Gammaproteobacteria bacterium]|nr:TonB-dependent receptor [Gammaproteobacteria bacterium]MDE0512947.1 TonB-dependent receptor [Gammaproteobacteria bacterium]